MNDQRWEEIKTLLAEKFDVLEHDEQAVSDPPSHIEWFVFEAPMGKMKLERVTRPRVIDRKVTASRRIGSSVKEEKVYATDEFTSFLRAYQFVQGEWEEMDPQLFTT